MPKSGAERVMEFREERRRQKLHKALEAVDATSDIELDTSLGSLYCKLWSRFASKLPTRGKVHALEAEMYIHTLYESERTKRADLMKKYQKVARRCGLPHHGAIGFSKIKRSCRLLEHEDRGGNKESYKPFRQSVFLAHIVAEAFNRMNGIMPEEVAFSIGTITASANIILMENGWHKDIVITEKYARKVVHRLRKSRFLTGGVWAEEGTKDVQIVSDLEKFMSVTTRDVSLYDLLRVVFKPSRRRIGVAEWPWHSLYRAWEYAHKIQTGKAAQETRKTEPSFNVEYTPRAQREHKRRKRLSDAEFRKRTLAKLKRPGRGEVRAQAPEERRRVFVNEDDDGTIDWDAEFADPEMQAMMAAMSKPRKWVEPEDTEESRAIEEQVMREYEEDKAKRIKEREEAVARRNAARFAPIEQADIDVYEELNARKKEADKRRAQEYFAKKRRGELEELW